MEQNQQSFRKLTAIVAILGGFTTLSLLVVMPSNFMRRESRILESSCHGLLHGGDYDFSGSTTKWQPLGCSLKLYSKSNLEQCLSELSYQTNRRATIVFLGDSRVRQLRDELFAQLTGMQIDWLSNKSIKFNPRIYWKHEDKTIRLPHISMKFFWTTEIWSAAKRIQNITADILETKEFPHLFVLGNGLWTMRHCQRRKMNLTVCLSEYQRLFQELLPSLSELAKHSQVLWVPQNALNDSHREDLADPDGPYFNVTIKAYNDVIQSSLKALPPNLNNIMYWESYQSTFSLQDSFDGMHIGPQAKYFDLQIMINLLCNPVTLDDHSDEFCCAKSNPYVQRNKLAIFLAVIVLIFISIILSRYRRFRGAN